MIRSKKVTLYNLLGKYSNSQIRVPDYQRGYSWESKQIEDFFTDLTTFAKVEFQKRPNDSYFMGPIVLMRGNPTD